MIRAAKHAWLERVGEKVAARRKELGFVSQRELAEVAGVSTNTAAQLERGQSWPQLAKRRKLEAALQWPEDALDAMRRDEPVPQPVTPMPPEEPQAPSMLNVARELAAAVRVCMNILSQYPDDETDAAVHLERSVRGMETMLAATLPDTGEESFHDTVAALQELHEIRTTPLSALG